MSKSQKLVRIIGERSPFDKVMGPDKSSQSSLQISPGEPVTSNSSPDLRHLTLVHLPVK